MDTLCGASRIRNNTEIYRVVPDSIFSPLSFRSIGSYKPITDHFLPSSFSSGPDGQYSKAIRKGGIKVKPKLGDENYLSRAEDM